MCENDDRNEGGYFLAAVEYIPAACASYRMSTPDTSRARTSVRSREESQVWRSSFRYQQEQDLAQDRKRVTVRAARLGDFDIRIQLVTAGDRRSFVHTGLIASCEAEHVQTKACPTVQMSIYAATHLSPTRCGYPLITAISTPTHIQPYLTLFASLIQSFIILILIHPDPKHLPHEPTMQPHPHRPTLLERYNIPPPLPPPYHLPLPLPLLKHLHLSPPHPSTSFIFTPIRKALHVRSVHPTSKPCPSVRTVQVHP